MADRRKKADDAAKAAAKTAFNTERKADPKPKNPNDGLGPKKVEQKKQIKSVAGGLGVVSIPPNRTGKHVYGKSGKPYLKDLYGSSKKKDPTPSNPNRGLGDSRKAAEAPKPKAKPQAAPKAKKAVSDAPKPKLKPSKAAAGEKAKKPSFSGNWKGAAPTAMQARGGAKKTGNGGLLGAIRRKLGK